MVKNDANIFLTKKKTKWQKFKILHTFVITCLYNPKKDWKYKIKITLLNLLKVDSDFVLKKMYSRDKKKILQNPNYINDTTSIVVL